MNSKKLFSSLFLSLILLLCPSCFNKDCNAKTAAIKDSITINIEKDPATLDGRKARLVNDYNLIRTFNEGLFRLDKSGNVSEAIAEKCDVIDDGKTYVIKLKETSWSNGEPLTAHDFIYSWKCSLSKDFPSPNAAFLFEIKNARLVKEGLLPVSMLGVHAKGDYGLVIELERPLPYFTKLLTMPVAFPVNESHDKECENWACSAKTYLCNGPFTIESWEHKNEIVAVKNKRYWDKEKVKLSKITMVMIDHETAFIMYQNNEIDLIGSPYSQIPIDALAHLKDSDIIHKLPLLGTRWIRTNVESHPLCDKDFRKSLAVAINRNDIVTHTLDGNGSIATGIVPKAMGLQDKPYFNDGNKEEAEKLLLSACQNLKIEKSEIPTLSITFVNRITDKKIAEVIQDQWRKNLGISVELEPLEYKVYLDKIQKGNYELAIGSWTADFNDPINFLEVFKTKDAGTNNTGWESPNYIAAIESTYSMHDKKVRHEALKSTEQLIVDEMPVIPLYHSIMANMYSDGLKDVIFAEIGTIDFKWAYVESN